MVNNQKLAYSIVSLVLGMIFLAFAAAPLYNIFCKVTGFGGTTQQAQYGSSVIGNKSIKVRFDANVSPDLKWRFFPEQNEVTVRTGENNIIFYKAENLTDEPIIGTSVYNVTPNKAGIYFNKIECFCFTDQLLEPGQVMTLPVSFFIDPDIEKDPTTKNLDSITLSYSFFRVKKK